MNYLKEKKNVCVCRFPLHNRCERYSVFSCTKATVPNNCSKNMHTPAIHSIPFFLFFIFFLIVSIRTIVQRRARTVDSPFVYECMDRLELAACLMVFVGLYCLTVVVSMWLIYFDVILSNVLCSNVLHTQIIHFPSKSSSTLFIFVSCMYLNVCFVSSISMFVMFLFFYILFVKFNWSTLHEVYGFFYHGNRAK